MAKFFDKIMTVVRRPKPQSFLRSVVGGSFYRLSDIKSDSDLADIKTTIDKMRALAKDSQVATALSYYATDATIPNSSGQIIWATTVPDGPKDAAELINALFRKWNINAYARDHILELATTGNLYLPTTDLYKDLSTRHMNVGVALDTNTVPDNGYDIIPSTKIPADDVIHVWQQGERKGFILSPTEEQKGKTSYLPSSSVIYPEQSIIHFALGGLLGDYQIAVRDKDGNDAVYDIQFADPLLEAALQPTQILNLLEDASILSSLVKVVRFINVDCGTTTEEEEIRDNLQQIKDAIQQQLSLNTDTGDTQSFLNPQSPNNLIYIPKVNGQDAVSVTDLNMKDDSENADKLLNYYQDKKLSVLGIPKEALNFSSAEGLGGAGAVMSQRSALYANSLQRIETAYMAGWTDALNKYFVAKGHSRYENKFELHMQPILTEMSALQFDKRDMAITQSSTLVDLLKSLRVDKPEVFKIALSEILGECMPKTSATISDTALDVSSETEETTL